MSRDYEATMDAPCPTCGGPTIAPTPGVPEESGWYCEKCGMAFEGHVVFDRPEQHAFGGMVSTMDAARLAGITYRQADHWMARGYISATLDLRPGSGRCRMLGFEQVRDLCVMAAFVRVGFTVDKASELTVTR